jgi:hypothetical protein
MIDLLSTDISDAVTIDTDFDLNDIIIELKLASIMSRIVQNCSNKIFQVGISLHMRIKIRSIDHLENSRKSDRFYG